MKIIIILNILEKYLNNNQKIWTFWAEHNIIGFNVDYNLISKEDKRALELLNVYYSNDYNSLIMHV